MHIIPMFLQDAASVPMGGMGGSGLITFVREVGNAETATRCCPDKKRHSSY